MVSQATATLTKKPNRNRLTVHGKDVTRFPYDCIEHHLGIAYYPDAPVAGLQDTPYKNNLAFSLTVEEVMKQKLFSDPRVIVLIPTMFHHECHRLRQIHISVESLVREGRYIRAGVTFRANCEMIHAFPPSVRMNAKAHLHIIVK